MGKVVTTNIPTPKEMKQIPIILDDGWIVSSANENTIFIKDGDGTRLGIKTSNLINNIHMDLGKKISNILISSINQMVDNDFNDTMKRENNQSSYTRTNKKIEKPFICQRKCLKQSISLIWILLMNLRIIFPNS